VVGVFVVVGGVVPWVVSRERELPEVEVVVAVVEGVAEGRGVADEGVGAGGAVVVLEGGEGDVEE